MYQTHGIMRQIPKNGLLMLSLMLLSARVLAAGPVMAQGSDPGFFLLLSGLIFILLFFNYVFFRKRRRKSLQLITDLEVKIEKSEKSIEEIGLHATDIAARKKTMLAQEARDLEKNLKAMQATLSTAHESAQRNSILLSNISHTLRTNLNDILGFSYLLGNEFAKEENAELFEFSENIRKSGESLMHLLNNIIDISRIEANTFNLGKQNCNLNTLIEELKAEFQAAARQKGLQLFFECEDIPLFSTDLEALTHILSNLLDNAIKYSGSGYVKVIMKAENERVVIAVKDTGTGIDKAYQEEIFEPFRRQSLGYSSTTFQGAGLGLPLVKQMLSLMGGSIELESEKAVGTTVTVRIPRGKAQFESFTPGADRNQATRRNQEVRLRHNIQNMLVIDNDNLNNMLIRKMLPRVPQLTFATSEGELEKIIDKNSKKGQPFDIVILNIDFLGVNGGTRLREKLQQDHPVFRKTPFVALSDIMDFGLDEKMVKAGFTTYLSKPINKEKLLNTMNTTINQ